MDPLLVIEALRPVRPSPDPGDVLRARLPFQCAWGARSYSRCGDGSAVSRYIGAMQRLTAVGGLGEFVGRPQPRDQLPIHLCGFLEPDFEVPAIRGGLFAPGDSRVPDVGG